LLTALGLNPQHAFWLKVGGGKPVGMGTIEARPQAFTSKADVPKTGRVGGGQSLAGTDLSTRIEAWAIQGSVLLWRQGLDRLRELWKPENLDREMPSGTY